MNGVKLVVISRATAVQESRVIYFQPLDGRFLSELAEYFDEVTVVAPIVYPGHSKYAIYAGYRYKFPTDLLNLIRLPDSTLLTWKCIWRECRDADIVLAFMPTFHGVVASLIGSIQRKPLAVYLGSDWKKSYLAVRGNTVWARLRAGLYGWLEKIAMTLADLRIVAGKELLQKYRQWPATYETITIHQIKAEHLFERDDTCQTQPIRLLAVGSLTPRKGYPELIEACYLLSRTGLPFALRIVGADNEGYQSYLQSRVATYGLNGTVEFSGYCGELSELLEHYRWADIFIHAAHHEGYPRVIDEAMSQSLPVVCTATGGVPRALADRVNALIVPPGSPQAIADAVLSLVNDPYLRRKLIRNGFERMQSKLNNQLSPAAHFASLAIRHGLINETLFLRKGDIN